MKVRVLRGLLLHELSHGEGTSFEGVTTTCLFQEDKMKIVLL